MTQLFLAGQYGTIIDPENESRLITIRGSQFINKTKNLLFIFPLDACDWTMRMLSGTIVALSPSSNDISIIIPYTATYNQRYLIENFLMGRSSKKKPDFLHYMTLHFLQ